MLQVSKTTRVIRTVIPWENAGLPDNFYASPRYRHQPLGCRAGRGDYTRGSLTTCVTYCGRLCYR